MGAGERAHTVAQGVVRSARLMYLPFHIGPVHDSAVAYLHDHRKELLERFAGDTICPPVADPFSIFMAGSPGAGKTEYSKTWIQKTNASLVRIDTDEVRGWFPMYTGSNSSEVQHAAALGVQKLYDYVLKKKKNILIDSTFTPYETVEENVERSLRRGRYVEVHYIFQDPLVAWDFTKKREHVEGRFVPKEMFVEALFESRANVQRIQAKFGSDVKVTFVMKDYQNDTFLEHYYGVNEIDGRTEMKYTKEELLARLS